MLSLEYLINNSGDSILEDYSYSLGVLTTNLNLSEADRNVKLRIRTDSLSLDKFCLEKRETEYRNCRIEIRELANVISVENGIYIAPIGFGKLMNVNQIIISLMEEKFQT